MIESIIAILLVTAALSFVRISLNSQNNMEYSARQNLAIQMAIYDFSMQLAGNSSTVTCLGNSACRAVILGYYREAYNLNSFEIVQNSSPADYVTRCLPYWNGTDQDEICIGAD